MLKDLRFAIRSFLKQPTFTAVVVITLALGIGANTAIFSVVNAALLQPLPFPEPDQLYFLRTAMTDGRPTSGKVSPVQLTRLNTVSKTVKVASGTYLYELSLMPPDGGVIKTLAYGVAEGFFEVFGVQMALGRAPGPEEHVVGGPGGIVVSYRVWRDVLGSNPNIIGTNVRMDSGTGAGQTVVGVAPPEFDFPVGTDVWFALAFPPEMPGHLYDGYLRAAPGMSLNQLRSEGRTIMEALGEVNPDFNLNREFVFEPLLESVVGDMGQTIKILFGATAVLLLIACINVTNLLLSRGTVRAREIALRVAVGASRARIVRQLLTESFLLTLIGATLGLGLSVVGVRLLLLVGPADLPRLESVPIDGNVLLFTLGSALLVALLMGFAPALRLARSDLRSLVNEGGRGGSAGPGRNRLLGALVTAEIAMAVVLVIGAGLLVRSFFNMLETDRGFRSERRLTLEIALPFATYPPNSEDYSGMARFYTELLESLRQMNGVEAVTVTSSLPAGRDVDSVNAYEVFGQITPEGVEPLRAKRRTVGPDFFSTMGTSLVAGHGFSSFDQRDTRGVAVVNEEFAKRFFPGQDPLGQRIVMNILKNPLLEVATEQVEVVGVVGPMKYGSLNDQPEPTMYTVYTQTPRRLMHIVLRSPGNPNLVIPSVREQISSMDPNLPVEFHLYSDLINASLGRERMGMMLLVVFGAVALMLAAVGTYGVIAYTVTQRRGEIAIRAAMGASGSQVLGLIMQHGLLLALVGVVAGIIGAVALRQVIASQLYGMGVLDVRVFMSVPTVLLLVALLATLFPALRAMKIDPAIMLRTE